MVSVEYARYYAVEDETNPRCAHARQNERRLDSALVLSMPVV